MKYFKVLGNGLVTGLIIQLAVGPIFFFIINLALQRSLLDGLAGVLAVTLVDYGYILLAALGVGKLLEKSHTKKIFGIISAIVLVIFGLLITKSILAGGLSVASEVNSTNLLSSFASVFVLAASSPLVIAFNMSLFASKAVECHYSKKEIFIFGFGIGLATLLFIGSLVIVLWSIGGFIPSVLVKVLNAIVGCVLIGYGGVRLMKLTRPPDPHASK